MRPRACPSGSLVLGHHHVHPRPSQRNRYHHFPPLTEKETACRPCFSNAGPQLPPLGVFKPLVTSEVGPVTDSGAVQNELPLQGSGAFPQPSPPLLQGGVDDL